MGVIITGIGGAVPANAVSNVAIAQGLDTTPDWISTRTGIQSRRHSDFGVTTSVLAVEAARNAIASSRSTRPIDMLLLATTTPDRTCPATAPKVAARLGLGPVSACDVAAVCSGFIYALQLAVGAISSRSASRVLVIGAETYSTLLDPNDRGTFPIFGDGAGAMIVEAGEGADVLDVTTGSDGRFEDLITVRGGGSEARLNHAMAGRDDPYFRMEGRTVFAKAVETMVGSLSDILKRNDVPVEAVDFVVGHQANARILTALGEQLGVEPEKVIVSLDRYGNTSAASIPLALADAAGRSQFRSGCRIALTAFGGGVSWGSALIRWPDLAETPVISQVNAVTAQCA